MNFFRYISISLMALFLAINLYAQPEALPKTQLQVGSGTIIKTNPMAILWGPIPFSAEYRLVYETLIMPRQSLLVGASYLGKSLLLTMSEMMDSSLQNQAKTKVNGFRVQLEYRLYFKNKNAPSWGYYIAPHFSYSKADFYDEYYINFGYITQFRYMDYGIIVGNQNVLASSALDIWIGAGYKQHYAYWIQPKKIEEIDDYEPFLLHLKLYFGINFGIAR